VATGVGPPGQSCRIPATFTPGAVGIRSALLTVTHSQQGRAGSVVVQLTGTSTGVARNATLRFTPNPLTFAEQLGLTTSVTLVWAEPSPRACCPAASSSRRSPSRRTPPAR
jgi:hypothetical protein